MQHTNVVFLRLAPAHASAGHRGGPLSSQSKPALRRPSTRRPQAAPFVAKRQRDRHVPSSMHLGAPASGRPTGWRAAPSACRHTRLNGSTSVALRESRQWISRPCHAVGREALPPGARNWHTAEMVSAAKVCSRRVNTLWSSSTTAWRSPCTSIVPPSTHVMRHAAMPQRYRRWRSNGRAGPKPRKPSLLVCERQPAADLHDHRACP